MHASAVVLGDRGVLISGPSGSGKTGLALALIAHARASGVFSRLIGDDQLYLTAHHGRLLCAVPSPIAGLAELRGLGPRALAFEPKAAVDLHVRLVEPSEAPRFPDAETEIIAGCEIRVLSLAAGDRQAAVLAVAACLCLPPFDRP